MKPAFSFVGLCIYAFVLSSCASDAAIRAYAITAEEQATLMQLTFDRCLNEQNQKAKEAACNAVKSSIETYKMSASELKSIKSSY